MEKEALNDAVGARHRHGRAQFRRRRRHRPDHRARLPAFASDNLATLIWANETLRLPAYEAEKRATR